LFIAGMTNISLPAPPYQNPGTRGYGIPEGGLIKEVRETPVWKSDYKSVVVVGFRKGE
jgi:hypothetical protein